MALRRSSPAIEPAGTLVSGDVRKHNLGIVARYLVDNGPSSRSQIADGTGLTRGSVTALSTLLIEGGILREAAPPDARGKGRPLTLLHLTGHHLAILALQLDADQVTGYLTTLTGEPLMRIAEQHGRPMGNPEPVLDAMANVLGRCLDECRELGRRLAELTVVVFAPVGGEPPVVIADTDLGWQTVDVLAGLRQREPRIPDCTTLFPDITLAAQAELGLLEGADDIIYLKSNSGIGGAIIHHGETVVGAHQLAGSLGHVPLVPDGDPCACGQSGCLVTVAGPEAILDAAGLSDLLDSAGLTAALEELTSRILAGDPRAVAAWDVAVEWIARVLQVLSMSFDPQAIVIGGYWAALVDSIAARFAQNRPRPAPGAASIDPAVLAGRLSRDAALAGAIAGARDRALLAPSRNYI